MGIGGLGERRQGFLGIKRKVRDKRNFNWNCREKVGEFKFFAGF